MFNKGLRLSIAWEIQDVLRRWPRSGGFDGRD